jgi:hypothetical protein
MPLKDLTFPLASESLLRHVVKCPTNMEFQTYLQGIYIYIYATEITKFGDYGTLKQICPISRKNISIKSQSSKILATTFTPNKCQKSKSKSHYDWYVSVSSPI